VCYLDGKQPAQREVAHANSAASDAPSPERAIDREPLGVTRFPDVSTMITTTDDPASRSLFVHVLRKDWGVAILAGAANGKRRYLFEDGEERTLADGYYQMMRRVAQPDVEQLAVHGRLRGTLAAREGRSSDPKAPGGSFPEQLARLHKIYRDGLSDPQWSSAIRGENEQQRATRHRQPVLDEARELLSRKAFDSQLGKQHHAPTMWEQLIAILRRTDLVPGAQLESNPLSPELMRALNVALGSLLHGTGAYEPRFDRYLAALTAAFGQTPEWELATAPSAIVHPKEHVCVEPTSFRKQLKLNGYKRSVMLPPSSAAYKTFLNGARFVANKLAEHHELSRDMLDVRDFIVLTVRPPSKARAVRAKAKAPAKMNVDSIDSDVNASDR
jgi:hypothetical protein